MSKLLATSISILFVSCGGFGSAKSKHTPPAGPTQTDGVSSQSRNDGDSAGPQKKDDNQPEKKDENLPDDSKTSQPSDSAPGKAAVLAPFSGIAQGMTFVKIPAGTFVMGSPDTREDWYADEGPQHKVAISEGINMQTTEVTQSQWAVVMGSNPSFFRRRENCPGEFATLNDIPMCPNNPVETVSWNDVQAFLSKVNAKADGYRYRLPTEAEWEYAARAGTTGAYAGDLDSMAWYETNSQAMTHPVHTKKANAWGLFDMQGNVSEWTNDWYGRYFPRSDVDPERPCLGAGDCVIRGGSWYNSPPGCRSALRDFNSKFTQNPRVGFRLVRTGT